MKYTPDNISFLASNEIFTFGANRRFVHGAGAARQALQWGARHGFGGLQGQTYALPTKDENIVTLPFAEIQKEINKFYQVTKHHSDKTFLVTKVGCGLAGLTLDEVAPLFAQIYDDIKHRITKNITLPQEFCRILEGGYPF